jgi:hypothetical protein
VLRLFRRREAARDPHVEELKAVVRRTLTLDDKAAVTISEIACGDPACPGNETVVLVMRPDAKTRAYRVQAPLAEVGEEELAAALAD